MQSIRWLYPVNFPLRWSCFKTILTFIPAFISALFSPAMMSFSFYYSRVELGQTTVLVLAHFSRSASFPRSDSVGKNIAYFCNKSFAPKGKIHVCSLSDLIYFSWIFYHFSPHRIHFNTWLPLNSGTIYLGVKHYMITQLCHNPPDPISTEDYHGKFSRSSSVG